MLTVASLLNPEPAGRPPVARPRPSPDSSSPTSSYTGERLLDRHLHSISKHNMTKESNGFAKAKAKGVVNFSPYDVLDAASVREARKYQVHPLGRVHEYCRHIPYNSGKKDFYEKTGRESFEVFQYSFKVSGDETEYIVMWDYNVGLVRMTPFFKCCKYSKTTPAKMLNLNPGLRDITHSITGGSIVAQGYWMPFACARAVCTTFCHHISGALIPIFGPKFPSECIDPEGPGYGRMIIDSAIIAASAREAEMFRCMFTAHGAGLPPSPSSHHDPRSMPHYTHAVLPLHPYGRMQVEYHRQLHPRGYTGLHSPYGSDAEGEAGEPSPVLIVGGYVLPESQTLGATVTSAAPERLPPSSGWTVANHESTNQLAYTHNQHSMYREEPPLYSPHALPDPILSAIPRATSLEQRNRALHGSQPQNHVNLLHPVVPQRQEPLTTSPSHSYPSTPSISTALKHTIWHKKRSANYTHRERDDEDGVGSSQSVERVAALPPTHQLSEGTKNHSSRPGLPGMAAGPLDRPIATSLANTNGSEKNAAMMLMHLSVRDIENETDKKQFGTGQAQKESCHVRITSLGAAGASGTAQSASGGEVKSAETTAAVPLSTHTDMHRRKRQRATSM